MKTQKSVIFVAIISAITCMAFYTNTTSDVIYNLITNYFKNNAQEKVYVHVNSNNYFPGDTIWYKVYNVNTKDLKPSTQSKLVYVELINDEGKMVEQQKIYSDLKFNRGQFALDSVAQTGTYTIRAYTNWMRNFDNPILFEQKVKISKENEENFDFNTKEVPLKIDLQFLPEGGQSISGISNIMAFKAVDNNGKSVYVDGSIFNEKDEKISDFKTTYLGMGRFYFTGEHQHKYYATLNQTPNKKYPLPTVKEFGFQVNIQKNNDDFILTTVKTNIPGGLNGATLVGLQREQPFFIQAINSDLQTYSLKLPTANLDNGVFQICVLDKSLQPASERLVFNFQTQKNIQATITVDQPVIKKRSIQKVHLQLKGILDSSYVANASISIYRQNQLNKKQNNIVSHLLLSSDIKGTVENASDYFENYDGKKRYFLDLLMLTQGWRNVSWNNILNYKPYFKKSFLAEKGINIEGNVSLFNVPLSEVQSNVTVLGGKENFFSNTIETDIKGRFSFKELVFSETMNLVFKAYRINQPKTKNPKEKLMVTIKEIETPQFVKDSIFKIRTDYSDQVLNPFNSKDINTIKEVIITKKLDKSLVSENSLHGNLGTKIVLDSTVTNYNSIVDYIVNNGRFRNILNDGKNNPKDSESVKSNNSTGLEEVLILVNDQIENINVLESISQKDVKYIDILRGAEANIYGPDAANGVIAIYTRSNQKVKINKNITNYLLKGFHSPRTFYIPHIQHVTTDRYLSKTRYLFWAPNVIFDEKGKIDFSFATGAIAGNYIIELEGLTFNGKPFYQTITFINE